MNRERFEDLKEAYVLNALPEDERREMEEYLMAHPERQAEVDDLNAVASLLALSPQEQEPSPQLRRNLMNAVSAGSVQPRATRAPLSARVRELFGFQRLALGAATLIVLAGLVSWNVLLQNQNNELQGSVQSLKSQVRQEQTKTYALKPAGSNGGASAEVVRLNGRHAILMANDMPAAPKNKTYQIWVIKNGSPQPAGLFDPKNGEAMAQVTRSLKGADAVAVTLEPSGGSKEPTSKPLMTANV